MPIRAPRPRATVKDVAARAGVSPKTVSNVLNSGVFVREETRKRVEAAIDELGYVPNLSARGLRNGRTGVVALALPDLSTPYSAEMAHHFVEAAHERGWGVQIEETGARPDREEQLLSRARARLVDGLVLNPIVSAELTLPEDAALIPPAVLIGEVDQPELDRVQVDPVQAAYDMTMRLIGMGHRHIAVVGSPQTTDTFTARLRTAGYRRALADAGIPHEPALEIGCDDWRPRGGAEAVDAFLGDAALPNALFCFTDSLAIGALSALWRRGIQVPQGIAVAGFDDIAHGEFASPPLTTVSFDKRAFADAALDRLAERIADRSRPVSVTTIPHRIVERESTRR